MCTHPYAAGMRAGVMISRTRHGRIVLLMLATGFSVACVMQAGAQTLPAEKDSDAEATEMTAANANDIDPENLELDWSQLNVDASTPGNPASKARFSVQTGRGSEMSWSSKDKSNGSAVSVKRPISPFWDTRIGADMTVTRQPQTMSELLSEKAANGGDAPQSSGTAWAAMTAPGIGSIWDKTAIEARVDPAQEQGRLGASLSKSLPLNEQYSLTLHNGYNVIQRGISPIGGFVGHPSRNYEVDRSAKLSIADTGTSFVAGQSLSSTNDKWLGKIGAEQKLFGDLTISGSIGETAQGTSNKSLSAGFKRSW